MISLYDEFVISYITKEVYMNSVEKMLTSKNIDLSLANPEFQRRQEIEQKFIASYPEQFAEYKEIATPIEQVYLSHPKDEFSLRVRAAYTESGPSYTATLKSDGEILNGQLHRLEVETEISADTFQQYSDNPNYPSVKKLRAEPAPGFTIDFIEGLETPLVEIENHPNGSTEFSRTITESLKDVTEDIQYYNETLAHSKNGEREYSHESIDNFAQRVVGDMIAQYSLGYERVTVGISGMSGSGKSSAVREIARALTEVMGDEFSPTVLSTDDYHRGKQWLEETYGAPWTNWDDPRVYNTAELAKDLRRRNNGEAIIKKHFDFDLEETVEDGIVEPGVFTIVEGVFAGSPDLQTVRQLHYEVPTSPAMSIGRDVRRLVLEGRANGSIGSPEDRLRYQLEVALPTYQEQQRPLRNVFAAQARPLAERAILLTRWSELQKYQ